MSKNRQQIGGIKQGIGSLRLMLCVIFFGSLLVGQGNAQSLAGITSVRDDSYSTASAYEAIRLSHPESQIVSLTAAPEVVQEKDQIYATIAQRNLRTDVFYPRQKTAQKRTAIIFLHGGGWRSGSSAQHHPLAQRLAMLGYICLTPEYRLSTEALFPAAVLDIKSLIRWLRTHAEQYHIDPNKIVIAGFSAGGELAAFVGATANITEFSGLPDASTNSMVNAIINIDGIVSFVHPESREGDDSKKLSAATLWLGYAKKDRPALWEAASPLKYAGINTPPTVFINSSVTRMHAGRDDYVRQLTQNHITTEVHTFPGAPHPFCLFEPGQTPTITLINQFLRTIFK